MPINSATGVLERLWRFVDHKNMGDKVLRSDVDIALDDLVPPINLALQESRLAYEGSVSGKNARRIEFIAREEDAGREIIDFWRAWGLDRAVATAPVVPIVPPVDSFFVENRARVIRRVEQLASFEWTPLAGTAGVPGARADMDRSTFGTLASDINDSQTTFAISDASKLHDPAGEIGEYTIKMSKIVSGIRLEELMTVTAKSGATLTVTRGSPSYSFATGTQVQDWYLGKPLMILPGDERRGPPYASIRPGTSGRVIGQDISIKTFLTALRNPNSVIYTRDLFFVSNAGRAVYAAVCSNFLDEGFNNNYSPTTYILSREWDQWGFTEEVLTFGPDDVQLGDVVITKGGGHIELVIAVTGTAITTFDQGYDGPRRTTHTKAGFISYAAGRDYKILRYDYGRTLIPYTPNPWSPLPDESLPAVEYNDVLCPDFGEDANYAIDEDVKITIFSDDVQSLVIQRDGVTIETVTTSGDEIITRSFGTVGTYSAYCVMGDDSHSRPVQWMVSGVTASLSASTAAVDAPLTVTFSGLNCTPQTIMLEEREQSTLSFGFVRDLTPGEIELGQATISHDRVGSYRVHVRGVNDFGASFSTADAMPVTIT